jgi:hypothetical protein
LIFGRPVPAPHPRRKHAYVDGICPCGAVYDPALAKRGRSAARLGKDQERAFEREHGPRKIGELGDPVDHIGAFGKYQVKSTRRPVTARLRNIDRMDGTLSPRPPPRRRGILAIEAEAAAEPLRLLRIAASRMEEAADCPYEKGWRMSDAPRLAAPAGEGRSRRRRADG